MKRWLICVLTLCLIGGSTTNAMSLQDALKRGQPPAPVWQLGRAWMDALMEGFGLHATPIGEVILSDVLYGDGVLYEYPDRNQAEASSALDQLLWELAQEATFCEIVPWETDEAIYHIVQHDTWLVVTMDESRRFLVAVFSSDTAREADFTYTQENDQVTITNYVGAGGNVVIPTIMGGYPVKSIGSGVFRYFKLAVVTMPDGLTSIGSYAFEGCKSLVAITIPDSVMRIDENAFLYCTSLTTVHLPNRLTSIEATTFYQCTALTTVNIPDRVTHIWDDAFYGCTSLAVIVLPDGLKHIGEQAFMSTGLTTITIPKSVKWIGKRTFQACTDLQSILFQGDAPSIGDSFLYNVPEDCTIYFYEGANGFSTPTSFGHPAVALAPGAEIPTKP